ncbi:MAG: energy-coupling factor transporter ATPase [Syntrophomonadaceae bacterium]|nr:energy-coupling factor transporter ATPase [Syntrophomonadaceae bacterium]
MFVIDGKNISYSYMFEDGTELAIAGVDIAVGQGEFVAILGHNGSGKSTLIKHFNALLPLQHGELRVAGIDVREEEHIWELRRCCGMVFQNPDNQFVSSVVEEDISFGLENYEVQRNEIPPRVKKALSLVGMEGFEKRSPHMLSGGQKQRIALAGVLALDPDIIIFDEVTAMLDPAGRQEVLSTIRSLHDQEHKTIIMISHYVEEAVMADKVYLIHEGKILASGTPRETLTNQELMQKTGLIPPIPVRIYNDLKTAGIKLHNCPLTNEELLEEICRLS